jgi:hypothetical protein
VNTAKEQDYLVDRKIQLLQEKNDLGLAGEENLHQQRELLASLTHRTHHTIFVVPVFWIKDRLHCKFCRKNFPNLLCGLREFTLSLP